MKTLLLIGTGSFIGGVSRHLLSQFFQAKMPSILPIGTLAVNVVGCFLIGLVLGYIDRETLTSEWRLFIITGLLGGFTTFSAFSWETVNLFKDGLVGYAIIYIGLSIFIGLLATYLAYKITN